MATEDSKTKHDGATSGTSEQAAVPETLQAESQANVSNQRKYNLRKLTIIVIIITVIGSIVCAEIAVNVGWNFGSQKSTTDTG